ncbi:MAG: hypothetical protein ACR2FM_05865 [Candidatus Saccharimonadales bacterium]
MRVKQTLHFVAIVALILPVLNVQSILFAQSASPNYRVEESYFGSGGQVDATSGNYRARQSTGALGVGDSASANYRASAGFGTNDTGFLEFLVTGGTVDLGTLTSDTVASSGAAQAGGCNCSFYVRTYLSSEYIVTTMSNPPTAGSAMIDAKTVLGVPSTSDNVEEFGMNLVGNSSPSIGADPINSPDGTFADGKAATGYGTPNQFKYVVGDIVARSPATAGNQAIGLTNYTVSYIIKKKVLTEAGAYSMQHDLVVTATY